MGRPKGLRKGSDGKWYMPEDAQQEPEQQIEKAIKQEVAMAKYLPTISKESKNVREETYKRNETVSVHNGIVWEPGLVLGYLRHKVVVQLLQDGNPRVLASENLVRPHPSPEDVGEVNA